MNPHTHQPGFTRNVMLLACLFVAILASPFTSRAALADGLVIRGGTCSATAFKNGAASSQAVKGDYYLTGLSVNCTTATNKKADYTNYLNGIGMYANYCVATIDSLERLSVRITPDPAAGNPYHCLLDGKAKDIAKKLVRY